MAPNYRRRLYFFWYKKSDVYMQCQGQFPTVVGVIKSVVAIFLHLLHHPNVKYRDMKK